MKDVKVKGYTKESTYILKMNNVYDSIDVVRNFIENLPDYIDEDSREEALNNLTNISRNVRTLKRCK